LVVTAVAFVVAFAADFEASSVAAFAADFEASSLAADEVDCVAEVAFVGACFGSDRPSGACYFR